MSVEWKKKNGGLRKIPVVFREDHGLKKEELEELIKEKKENLKILEQEYGKNNAYIEELSNLAHLQLEAKNFESAEKNYRMCLKHFKKQKDRLGQAAVFGILGALYFQKKDYEQSIEYYEKAYEIYEVLKQSQEKIICLIGIGNNLIRLNDLDRATDKFLECSEFCSETNDIYGLLECLSNLIHIHEEQERWDVVFELYRKTLKAFKELNDKQGIITSYFNLGILMKKIENTEEALRYFKKGTNVAIETNYVESIIKGLSYISECLFYQGKLREAKNQLIKALHLAHKVDAKNAIIQLKVLLRSLGLKEEDIQKELQNYGNSDNNVNNKTNLI